MLDYALMFEKPPLPAMRTVALGELRLPTGRIYCCDPFLSHEAGPLETPVKPGAYPVELCVAALDDWGRRVVLARLVVAPRPVAAWREATFVVDGERQSQFHVDAGLACFMDQATRDRFVRTVNDFHAASDEANYYDDILAPQFKRNADPNRPSHAGDWAMHTPAEGAGGNIAMFASGLGDGEYRAYWGFDAVGDPVMLVADFGLLAPEEDEEEPAARP